MKTISVLTLAAVTLTAALCLASEIGSIAFTGLEADNEGAAAWNTDGSGPEPARWGHDIDWVPSYCLTYAYYYLASRDYIDGPTAAGMHCTEIMEGFPELTNALAANDYSIDQVTIRFGLMDLGDDLEGQDWNYNEEYHWETRHYSGGTFLIQLDGEDMVGGDMPMFTIWIDYNVLDDCLDDWISGLSEFCMPVDMSGGSSAGVQNVAEAFLTDLQSAGFRFTFESLQPAGQMEFSGEGRTGAYFEAQEGYLEWISIGDAGDPRPDRQPPFILHAAHPNPFNPLTRIRFDLVDPHFVELAVYSSDGRRVRTLVQQTFPSGSHEILWQGEDDRGRDVASGTYFYRIEAGHCIETRAMTLIR
jgi:hypothetical protein